MILCLWKQIDMFFEFGNSYVVDIFPRCQCLFISSWQQKTGGRGKLALTWSVIKRISFKIKPNSYSVDDLMHVWCVTASGIRVLPIGPMLPSSPCLEGGEKTDECIGKPLRRDYLSVYVRVCSLFLLLFLLLLLPINRAIESRIVWQCSAGRHGATIVPKIIINVEHIGQQRLRGASGVAGEKKRFLFSMWRDHWINWMRNRARRA